MKILSDTSVLIAAVVKPHPNHSKAFVWLKKARNKEIELIISSHSLAEMYHVLTRYPVKPKFSVSIVKKIIYENIKKIAKIVSLSPNEYMKVIEKVADYGLAGGIIYDALIAEVALKMNVDKLLTFNVKDFKKILPRNHSIICSP